MDIHLDTSWCPVCQQQILPKRYLVPVPPVAPPSSSLPIQQSPPPQKSQYAVKQSQTMRGKHGIIKARAQVGGLLHGTGRVRPGARGGLRRDPTLNNIVLAGQQSNGTRTRSPQKQSAERHQQQQQAQNFALEQACLFAQPPKQRTVIDQAQTPLYCSDECRRADMELDFGVSLSFPTPMAFSSNGIAAHRSCLNPAQASPPPPSPILPHVLNNSYRDKDADHSDSSLSSSMSGACFGTPSLTTTSQERSNLFTDPTPPPIAPLPLHPHRHSAPTVKVIVERSPPENKFYEGGIMMAARRLQHLIAEDAKSSTALKDEEQRKKEERKRDAWDLTKERRGLKSYGIGFGASAEVSRVNKEKETKKSIYPSEWSVVVYGHPQKEDGTSSNWIALTHRNPIGLIASVDGIATAKTSIIPQIKTSPTTATRRAAPSRGQSVLELYAEYPLFTRRTHSRSCQLLSALPTTSTSYTAAYAQNLSVASVTGRDDWANERKELRASTSEGGHSVGHGDKRCTRLYDGKYCLPTKHREPAPILPKGAEGRLLVPDVKLKLKNSFALFSPSSRPTSNSLAPSTTNNRASSMSRLPRNESERHGSGRYALNIVKEEGAWNVPPLSPDAGSEESQSSSGRHTDGVDCTWEYKGHKAKSRSSVRRSSSSTLSLAERGRLNMESATWNYGNAGIPTYDVMPPVPVKQYRIEEMFVPDVPGPDDKPAIHISSVHTRDKELSRRSLREVSRRRGDHDGRPGWWVEKEWEVTAIPERKRLFLFNSRP